MDTPLEASEELRRKDSGRGRVEMSENLRHAIAYEKLLSEKETLEAERDTLKEQRTIQFERIFKRNSELAKALGRVEAAEFHLAEVQKLIEKWRNDPDWDMILPRCADELEAAIGVEAEG